MKNIRIASWNICLGVSNKLNHIENVLNQENIDVLFIQECEIQNQTNKKFYDIKGYILVICGTIISGKARTCCYIKNNINFTHNNEDENAVEIISLKIENLTINGLYRPFKTPLHNTGYEYLQECIQKLNNYPKTQHKILIGDFNLDSKKKKTQHTRTDICLSYWMDT